MQEKLKALTGVDIVDSSGAYKDTYTILKEIGSVWAELSDMDQAAALELMAGKNRANTLSALLSNMQDLEGAYKSAMNAEGSALKENEAYLDSIQGRIDLFTNSLQTMWMNFINDDVVKFIVDVGRGLITLIDKLGALETIIIGYMGYLTFVKKTDWQKISNSILGFFGIGKGKIQKLEGDALTQEIALVNKYAQQGSTELQKYANSITATKNGMYTYISQVKDGKYTAEGYTAAMKNMTAAQKQAATEAEIAAQKQLKHNIAVFALTTAFTVGIDIIKHFTQDNELLSESYDKLQSSISSLTSELDSLHSELESVQDRISELSGKKLSITEAEELQTLKAQSDELQRQIGLKETLLEGREQQNQVTTLAKINDMLKTTAAGQADAVETAKTVGGWVGKLLDVALIAGGVAVTGLTGGLATAGGAAMIAAGSSGLGSAAAEGIGGLIANEAYDTKNGTLLEWYESYRDAIEKAQQEASVAESKYFSTLNDDDYEKWQTKVNKLSGLQTELFNGLEELQGYMSNLEYNDTTAPTIDAYNKMMAQIEIENVGDGVQSRIDAIESLRAEYEELSKGIGANGENMALSAKEYSRYLSIVQQLIAFSPDLADTYDSESKSIANRNSLIDEGIKLIRDQQKAEAEAKTTAKKLWETYNTERESIDKQIKEVEKTKQPLNGMHWASTLKKDLEKITGETFGFDETHSEYIVRNADVIRANLDKVLAAARNYYTNDDMYNSYESYVNNILTRLGDINSNMPQFKSLLYNIPLASGYYHDLEGSHISFINSYINSLGDLSGLSEDEVKEIRQNILNLTEVLATDGTSQGIAENIFAINPDIPAQAYKTAITDAVAKLVEQKVVPDNMQDALVRELFPDTDKIDTMSTFVKQKLEDSYDDAVDGLSVAELKIAYRFVKDAEDGSLDWTDIEEALISTKDIMSINPYSTLSESVSKYQEKLQQALEITTDGTLITQEFKDELIALGISEEKLAECFSENNDLLIENADAFNEVVQAGKEVIAGNIRIAKSRAQLKYNDLIDELRVTTQHYEGFTAESQAAADALIDQISTIKNSINQYQQLEDALLGTANAFDKFAKAQEADSQNIYGESYVSMAQTMYDAIYKTGQVGSAQFWAAVQATVPDNIYMHLLPGEEQINAIVKYLNSNVFPTLTLSEDSFSIDYSDIESFVEKAQDVGLFTGKDAKSFGLSMDFIYGLEEDENALKAFADRMGMTVTQVYAMLSELDKYNADGLGLSTLLQLDRSTSGQITTVNSGLEKLYIQRKALIEQSKAMDKAGEDTTEIQNKLTINQDSIDAYEAQLAGLHKQATTTVEEFARIDNIMLRIGDIDDMTVEELKELIPNEVETRLELTGAETVEDVYKKLVDYRLEFEEPTVMELDVAQDAINEELDALIKQYGETELELGVKYDVNGTGLREVNYDNLTLDAATLERYVELKNANLFIDNTLEEGLTTTEQYLSRIAENTDIMAGKNEQPEAQHEDAGGGEASDSGAGRDESGADSRLARTGGGGQVSEGSGANGSQDDPVQQDWLDTSTSAGKLYRDAVLGNQNDGKDSMMPQYGSEYVDPATISGGIDANNVVIEDANVDEVVGETATAGQSPTSNQNQQTKTTDSITNSVEQMKELGDAAEVALSEVEKIYQAFGSPDEKIKSLKRVTDEKGLGYELTDMEALAFGIQVVEGQTITAADAWAHLRAEIEATQQKGSLVNPEIFAPKATMTYSELQNQATAFNEVLAQTDEIIADNTEVTQAYMDSLLDMYDTDAEKKEAQAQLFDERNNKIIVKNSKELKKLVKEKRRELATDVKLSKAQSQLEYYDLVKQLSGTLIGVEELDNATMEHVNSILSQIDVVQQSIYKFQLLEDQLLGTTSAFEKYKEAQEIDGLNTYGDDYVSMVQTMYDAFYKTGEVGSEANWEAIQALVPPEVYQHLKNEGDQLKAIYKYFNKNILPTLTLKDDQFSLDYDATENFVEKGMDKGVFVEDKTKDGKTNLDLVEGMNLEKAAELMGMTETQAYAMFAALDKFNFNGSGQSFLEKLDDSLSGDIMEVTSNIEELNREKLALLEGGITGDEQKRIDEINASLVQNKQELQGLGATAYDTWQQYVQVDSVLAKLGEIEDASTKVSNVLPEEVITSLGLTGNETVQQAYDILLAKQLELEEPTVLTAQLAIENIDSQIADLKERIKLIDDDTTLTPEVKAAKTEELDAQIQKLEEDKVVIAADFGIELSEEDKKNLQDKLDAVEKFKINDKEFTVVGKGTSETMQWLEKINGYTIANKSYTTTHRVITTNEVRSVHTSTPTSHGGRYTMANGTAHARGTAHTGGSWGALKSETALTGELGPELRVRGNRWELLGENGAEFNEVRKGDIIFNHKQTEDLLSNGYIAGRGKAYAGGTVGGAAYALWAPTSPNTPQSNPAGRDFSTIASNLNNASGQLSDAADEFREVFDWIEVRIEEINEDINLKSAKLENTIGYKKQNIIIDDMIELNQKLYDNLIAGSAEYHKYAAKLLEKVPAEYRNAAQNGAIAIEEFVGKVDEETLNAIQEYREWVQKGADATQQAEETLTEISTLAKQAIDNIAADYENKTSLRDSKIEQFEAYNALLETDVGYESEKIYRAMMKETNKNIKTITEQRNKMQAELNKRVESGQIKKYSQDWYDAINDISALDTQIIELKTDVEDWQDAINELHWDKLDDLMTRLEAVSNEAENLIDILGNKDAVDEAGNWTKEGITSLGLYAQQMEVAEMQAKKYKDEISYLNKNWKKLGYTEQEYVEKLEELKSAQYDAIKAYYDSRDAIVDLNKERVEEIKTIIEKEIEAYEKLISKKKEALDAEKD